MELVNKEKRILGGVDKKGFEKRIEIIKYALNHPFSSRNELAQKFNVSLSFVSELFKDIPKLKMDIEEKKWEAVVNAYDEILNDITDITKKTIKKYKNLVDSDTTLETRELRDLAAIGKETLERHNLMEGKATSNENITINFN